MNAKTYAYVKSRFFNSLIAVLSLAVFAAFLSHIANTADATLGAGTTHSIIPAAEDIGAILSGFHPMSAVRRLLCIISPHIAVAAESLWSIVKWIMNF